MMDSGGYAAAIRSGWGMFMDSRTLDCHGPLGSLLLCYFMPAAPTASPFSPPSSAALLCSMPPPQPLWEHQVAQPAGSTKSPLFPWFLPYPGQSFKDPLCAGSTPWSKASRMRPAGMGRAQAAWHRGMSSDPGAITASTSPGPHWASRKVFSAPIAQHCYKPQRRRFHFPSKSHVCLLIHSSLPLPYNIRPLFQALEASKFHRSKRM